MMAAYPQDFYFDMNYKTQKIDKHTHLLLYDECNATSAKSGRVRFNLCLIAHTANQQLQETTLCQPIICQNHS
jgi:hypothetical protein